MPEGGAYECPDCGARVKEEDTICISYGAVFEDNAEAHEKPAGEAASDVIDAELIRPEAGEEKPKETGQVPEKEKDEAEKAGKEKEEPPPKEKIKPGLNTTGLVIAVLGVLGLAGAILLDPILNIIDSAHPAGISIGPSQMAGIAVAALVLVAGVVIAFAMRRKGK